MSNPSQEVPLDKSLFTNALDKSQTQFTENLQNVAKLVTDLPVDQQPAFVEPIKGLETAFQTMTLAVLGSPLAEKGLNSTLSDELREAQEKIYKYEEEFVRYEIEYGKLALELGNQEHRLQTDSEVLNNDILQQVLDGETPSEMKTLYEKYSPKQLEEICLTIMQKAQSEESFDEALSRLVAIRQINSHLARYPEIQTLVNKK